MKNLIVTLIAIPIIALSSPILSEELDDYDLEIELILDEIELQILESCDETAEFLKESLLHRNFQEFMTKLDDVEDIYKTHTNLITYARKFYEEDRKDIDNLVTEYVASCEESLEWMNCEGQDCPDMPLEDEMEEFEGDKI